MSTSGSFAPIAAATGQFLNLSMQRLWLTGTVMPAGARLIVQHVFRSEEDKPLEVIYSFMLPRDAALRSFRILGEDFEVHSELQETEAAVKSYEQGIARGSLSTIARQYADGMINLTVGNIRPNETVTVFLEVLCGVELRDDGFRFRFPFTVAPSYHARAKAALISPGEGEMELPPDEFGDLILPRFLEDASALHQVGFELDLESQGAINEIGSPSHGIRVRQQDGRSPCVALSAERDVPNRDLILDVTYKSAQTQMLAGQDKTGRGSFCAIVPSTAFGVAPEVPRRVVILVDRSGSMQGEPLSQACKAIEACLGILGDQDQFGLVAFDSLPSVFESSLVPGTRKWRNKAHDFLKQVVAGGATELAEGVLEAAKLFAGAGGDILILTDGQVSGTEQILAHARSAEVRLHCLGIGSASQDRFLALLARETGGISRFVTPQERVDLSAVDLFASIGQPVATGLKVSANIQPAPPASVFRGTPVLLFGETTGTTDERIELSWSGGRLDLPVLFRNDTSAETIRLLQGSRLITDWESRYPSVESLAPLEKRRESRVGARLRELSQTYGLASREMSLVAVITRVGDRAGELPDTRVVPVGMALNTKLGTYLPDHSPGVLYSRVPTQGRARVGSQKASASPRPQFDDIFSQFFGAAGTTQSETKTGLVPDAVMSALLDLAARVEPDGGMLGKDREARALSSILALLAFLSQGNTPTQGAFRSHVARLASFLKSLTALSSQRQKVIAAVLEFARKGEAPAGDWIQFAQTTGDYWGNVEEAVKGSLAAS